jgi:hypothetical protein
MRKLRLAPLAALLVGLGSSSVVAAGNLEVSPVRLEAAVKTRS